MRLQRNGHHARARTRQVFDASEPAGVTPRRTRVRPGFAVNTLFYTAILWLFFAAPFALRRRRRITRGLCPACAYPVGGSPVCTECGKPLPQIAGRATVNRA